MQHIEIEYKTLLSQTDYQRLSQLFTDTAPVSQTNYYLETPNQAIKKAKMSLRIRTLPERAELTLKIPLAIGNEEHNQDLSLAQAQAILENLELPKGQIYDHLLKASIPLEELTCLGSLTTKRLEKAFPIGLMALDSNSYSGRQDYELELEVSDAKQGKADFDQFLQEQNIPYRYAKSKVARFVASLGQA